MLLLLEVLFFIIVTQRHRHPDCRLLVPRASCTDDGLWNKEFKVLRASSSAIVAMLLVRSLVSHNNDHMLFFGFYFYLEITMDVLGKGGGTAGFLRQFFIYFLANEITMCTP